MDSFQADPSFMGNLLDLIEKCVKSSNSPLTSRLEEYRRMPNFDCYLAFILASSHWQDKHISKEARALAGLVLKNNFHVEAKKADLPFGAPYIQQCLLFALMGTDIHLIQSTAGSAISMWLQKFGFSSWPNLIHILIKAVDQHISKSATDAQKIESHIVPVISTLTKICEDSGSYLATHQIEDTPYLIRKLLDWARDLSSSEAVHASLAALHELYPSCRAVMLNFPESMNDLFKILSSRASEAINFSSTASNPTLTKQGEKMLVLICQLLVTMMNYEENHVWIVSLVPFCIQLLKYQDENVSLQACEVWNTIILHFKDELYWEVRPHLHELIPLLLQKMIYDDADPVYQQFGQDRHVNPQNTTDSDIKPRNYSHSAAETAGDSDSDQHESGKEEEWDEEDQVSEWNIRKCAASTLDALSLWMDPKLIQQALIPNLSNATAHSDWKIREVGVLGLGAVGPNCMSILGPFLNDILSGLCQLMSDKWPLVRSISAWTLSRYSRWDSLSSPLLYRIMDSLLAAFNDPNPRVQGAVFSAIACYIEDIPILVTQPLFVKNLLQLVTKQLPLVSHKNRLALLDLLTTLGSSLSHSFHNTSTSAPPTDSSLKSPSSAGLFPLSLRIELFEIIVSPITTLLCNANEFSNDIIFILQAISSLFPSFYLWSPADRSSKNDTTSPNSEQYDMLSNHTFSILFAHIWTYSIDTFSIAEEDEVAEMEVLGEASIDALAVLMVQLPTSSLSSLLEAQKNPSWKDWLVRGLSYPNSFLLKAAMARWFRVLCQNHPALVLPDAMSFLSFTVRFITNELQLYELNMDANKSKTSTNTSRNVSGEMASEYQYLNNEQEDDFVTDIKSRLLQYLQMFTALLGLIETLALPTYPTAPFLLKRLYADRSNRQNLPNANHPIIDYSSFLQFPIHYSSQTWEPFLQLVFSVFLNTFQTNLLRISKANSLFDPDELDNTMVSNSNQNDSLEDPPQGNRSKFRSKKWIDRWCRVIAKLVSLFPQAIQMQNVSSNKSTNPTIKNDPLNFSNWFHVWWQLTKSNDMSSSLKHSMARFFLYLLCSSPSTPPFLHEFLDQV